LCGIRCSTGEEVYIYSLYVCMYVCMYDMRIENEYIVIIGVIYNAKVKPQ